MRGGKRPGAGRKPGSKNKASAAREKAIAESGLTPLEYMLSVMRNDETPRDVRLEAARSAAPYVHPRLNSVEHKGDLHHHYHDDAQSVAGKLLPELAGPGAPAPTGSTH